MSCYIDILRETVFLLNTTTTTGPHYYYCISLLKSITGSHILQLNSTTAKIYNWIPLYLLDPALLLNNNTGSHYYFWIHPTTELDLWIPLLLMDPTSTTDYRIRKPLLDSSYYWNLLLDPTTTTGSTLLLLDPPDY